MAVRSISSAFSLHYSEERFAQITIDMCVERRAQRHRRFELMSSHAGEILAEGIISFLRNAKVVPRATADRLIDAQK